MAKRYLARLVLALPFLVAMAPAMADAPRTIDVAVSRYAFTPEKIEMRVGERVRLNVRSMDRGHGFQVKELGLDAQVPSRGMVTVDVMPTEAGTFEVACSDYCGPGHMRMRARIVVSPAQ